MVSDDGSQEMGYSKISALSYATHILTNLVHASKQESKWKQLHTQAIKIAT